MDLYYKKPINKCPGVRNSRAFFLTLNLHTAFIFNNWTPIKNQTISIIFEIFSPPFIFNNKKPGRLPELFLHINDIAP